MDNIKNKLRNFVDSESEILKAKYRLVLYRVAIALVVIGVSAFVTLEIHQSSMEEYFSKLKTEDDVQLYNALADQEEDFQRKIITIAFFSFLAVVIIGFAVTGKVLRPINRLVEEREEFAGNISHELKTPLSTIKAEIEALLRKRQKIPKDCKVLFQSINEEVEYMSRLTENLLVLVRSYGEGSGNGWRKINLSEFLEDIAIKANNFYGMEKVKVNLGSKSLTINGNLDQLKQLFQIILDNAIKYSPNESMVKVGMKKYNGKIQVSIKDYGVGIAKEDLPYIFDRFYRAPNVILLNNRGSGLGLAIASKIADMHKCQINVKSKLGSGTTFTLIFPEGD